MTSAENALFLTIKNGIKQSFQKFTCKLQIIILCMFICVYDITYVKTLFNVWKLRNFQFMRNGQKDHEYVENFFYKINKNMQRKLRIKCFVHLRFWHHSHQIQNLVTSWLCENWSKHQKTLYKALFPWNHYNYAMKIGVSFWSQVSFKSSFKLLLFFVVVHEKYVLKLKQ